MAETSVDRFLADLRVTNLLRAEQFTQLVTEIAAKFEKASDLAKHLLGQGWITQYQAVELLNSRGSALVLGPYSILDTIGEGGMGRVFKAKQLRLNRLVALKVIHPNLINDELALKRFRRESTAAAQLNHPNIVRLYDADQVGDRHFLVMEYVSGVDLSDRVVDVGCLPIETACSYIRQAALGLQHAHDLGLFHRDIKPSNLLLTIADPGAKTCGGVIKILDMGLARIAPDLYDDSDLTSLTQEGSVIGTPDFMSPEQAKNGSDADARSDLYSLGCTFFFLLTGHPPFCRGTALERLLQHQLDAPPQIQTHRPDVPNEVATIIHILLAKRPEDRFQSGLALADALEPWSVVEKAAPLPVAFKNSAPVVLRPPTPTDAPVVTIKNGGKLDRTVLLPPPPPTDAPNNALPQIQSEPEPLKVSRKNEAVPSRDRRRRFAWLAAIFVAAGSIVVGFNVASKAVNKQTTSNSNSSPEHTKEAPRPPINKVAELPSKPRKAARQPLGAFLPVDTEFVAIIDVKQLAKSKSFVEQIKPKFEAELKALYTSALFDPLAAVDRVIVAVPSLAENQEIMIVQGSDFLTSDLLNWLGMLPDVQVTPTAVPGHGMKDVYRLIHDKDTGGLDLFGAILSINPSRVVLSPSKERVIEALARVTQTAETQFDDPTIQPMLAGYGLKPTGESAQPAVWMALGACGKRFGFGNSSASGLQSIIGTLRLEDGLDMEVTLQAGRREEVVAAWSKITQFAREKMAKTPADTRSQRIASLLLQATPIRFPDANSDMTFVGNWSVQIEAENLPEWFAPFIKSN